MGPRGEMKQIGHHPGQTITKESLTASNYAVTSCTLPLAQLDTLSSRKKEPFHPNAVTWNQRDDQATSSKLFSTDRLTNSFAGRIQYHLAEDDKTRMVYMMRGPRDITTVKLFF